MILLLVRILLQESRTEQTSSMFSCAVRGSCALQAKRCPCIVIRISERQKAVTAEPVQINYVCFTVGPTPWNCSAVVPPRVAVCMSNSSTSCVKTAEPMATTFRAGLTISFR